MFRRRRLQVAAVATGALLVASAIAVVKPRDYRAETLLRITGAQSLPAEQLAQRVDAIARQVVAPTTLQHVAERLAAEGVDLAALEARSDVVAAPTEDGAWEVTISHVAPDPDVAAHVVETLASDYQASAVERPIQNKEREIERLAAEADETRQALAARQDELDRYVLENESYLEGPEQRLTAVRDQIRDVERIEIASYEGEVRRLDQLLEEEPEFIVEEKSVRDEDRIRSLRKEIRDVEAELTVLQVEQNRTDAHPAVVAKRKILSDLRNELDTVESDTRTDTVETPNEMYNSLAKAKIEAEADLARARRKLTVLRTTESELLEEVRRAPGLRGERDRLVEAVDAAQATVAGAERKLENARAALEELRQEHPLQFETVVAPEPPSSPTGPGVLMIAGLGLLVGGFVGAGVALVADARDRSFRDARSVSEILGLPTLGAIDVMRTPAEERRNESTQRRRTNALAVMAFACVVLLAFAMLGDATVLQDMVRAVLR